MKKYKKIQEDRKKNEVINGKTVQEYETIMSKLNRKTLDFDKFKDYIKEKNKLNTMVEKLYTETIFRKLKLGSS